MKLLFTANRFPYPPYRGDKLKIFHLARELSADHEVHLLCFIQDPNDRKYLPELKAIFKEVYLVPLPKWKSYWNCLTGVFSRQPFQVRYFFSRQMEEMVRRLSQAGFDAVHVQHLRMAPYWAAISSVPRILDLPDAYSLYWHRRVAAARGLRKWLTRIEYRRVWRFEKVLRQYPLTLVCSQEDRDYLARQHQLDNLALLPNGVDLQVFSGDPHDYQLSDVILFTGNMDYAPNVDAVVYFSKEILPLIVEACPQARLVIAGQRPVKKVLDLVSDRITVTGFVPDLAEVYRKAAIVVAPLRFGAGTQNKVLEAMAMGVPVVSRDIGFSGLNIQSGEGVIKAMDSRAFADACIGLLGDADRREVLGRKGQAVIRTRFDWKVVSAQLERYFREVNAAAKPADSPAVPENQATPGNDD